MYCPTCRRDVVTKTGINWGVAATSFLKFCLLVFLVALVLPIAAYGLWMLPLLLAFLRSKFTYCPACYTELKPSKDDADVFRFFEEFSEDNTEKIQNSKPRPPAPRA